MKTNHPLERKLHERLLLAPRIEGDRLVLSDDVITAALDGSRALTVAERAALQASPLTLRRFRRLAMARTAGGRHAGYPQAAANDAWHGSAGMLRAASGGAALTELLTDDRHWALHFVEQGQAWRLILALDAAAPFAARLLREQPLLRVVDGGGAILLQGRLDADGECECDWPFDSAPAPHFQQFGAGFSVEPVHA